MAKDKHIRIRASDEFLKAVEDWRKKQSPLPNQSEAIRKLVTLGLSKKRFPHP